MIPGLSERVTSGKLGVLRLHYTADPLKRPGTPEGDIWIAEASAGYPGGVNSPRWLKEMEIEWGAMGGTRLFPKWEEWLGYGTLVIDPFEPVGYTLYGSYDHGWRNPAAYHVHGVGRDRQIVTLWEFYADHVPVSCISKIIKGENVTTPDGRHFAGNPLAGREILKIADPHLWAEDQPMADNTNKSTAYLFEQEKIFFDPGERGGDTTVAEWLLGYFWMDPRKPLYRIVRTCERLIWELGQQRHKEISAHLALTRDLPEQLVDKNNHAWDGLKMFLKKFPPPPMGKRIEQKPDTFLWWREQAKKAKEGLPLSTYHREMIG